MKNIHVDSKRNEDLIPSYVTNKELIQWVQNVYELCEPANVYWCDGSEEEYNSLCQQMVDTGMFIKLNDI